jgi:phage-related minor tail protein
MTDAEKTDAISQIFNKTDIASVNALLNTSSSRFEELSGAIGDATGSAQAMADVQLDNFNGQITLLKSALEGAAIAIGEKLTPYVSALVEKVQGAVDWFNSLSDSQQDLIVKIGLVVAAIGPALVIVGKIVSVVGSITSAVGSFITFIPTLTAALTAVGACITGTVIPAIVSVVTAIAPGKTVIRLEMIRKATGEKLIIAPTVLVVSEAVNEKKSNEENNAKPRDKE